RDVAHRLLRDVLGQVGPAEHGHARGRGVRGDGPGRDRERVLRGAQRDGGQEAAVAELGREDQAEGLRDQGQGRAGAPVGRRLLEGLHLLLGLLQLLLHAAVVARGQGGRVLQGLEPEVEEGGHGGVVVQGQPLRELRGHLVEDLADEDREHAHHGQRAHRAHEGDKLRGLHGQQARDEEGFVSDL
ncbi:unnamed protein product, partial [Heterosigma akashiwo]